MTLTGWACPRAECGRRRLHHLETVPTIRRDVGGSGSTGTQERRGRHQLNGRLAAGDTLVVAIDPASAAAGRTS